MTRFLATIVSVCLFALNPSGEAQGQGRPAVKKTQSAKTSSAKKTKTTPEFSWVNEPGKKTHPSLKHATFKSELVDAEVGYMILLPKDDSDAGKRYPVVYHLHGGRPGSELKAIGIVASIIKTSQSLNLLPLIHVFVNGGPMSHYNVPDVKGSRGADVFVRELIPHIDATYPTIADRSGRVLTGFSQGGRGTMRLSMRYPALFAGAVAGGGGYATEKAIQTSGGFERPDLKFAEGDNVWDLAAGYDAQDQHHVELLIYVGTKGFNYENNLEYMEYLTELGINFQKLIGEGIDHSNRKFYDQHGEMLLRFISEVLER